MGKLASQYDGGVSNKLGKKPFDVVYWNNNEELNIYQE